VWKNRLTERDGSAHAANAKTEIIFVVFSFHIILSHILSLICILQYARLPASRVACKTLISLLKHAAVYFNFSVFVIQKCIRSYDGLVNYLMGPVFKKTLGAIVWWESSRSPQDITSELHTFLVLLLDMRKQYVSNFANVAHGLEWLLEKQVEHAFVHLAKTYLQCNLF